MLREALYMQAQLRDAWKNSRQQMIIESVADNVVTLGWLCCRERARKRKIIAAVNRQVTEDNFINF